MVQHFAGGRAARRSRGFIGTYLKLQLVFEARKVKEVPAVHRRKLLQPKNGAISGLDRPVGDNICSVRHRLGRVPRALWCRNVDCDKSNKMFRREEVDKGAKRQEALSFVVCDGGGGKAVRTSTEFQH